MNKSNSDRKRPIKVDVAICITMSKCVNLKTDNYTIDPDGNIVLNDLEGDVKKLIDLPTENKAYKSWYNDEFLVELCSENLNINTMNW